MTLFLNLLAIVFIIFTFGYCVGWVACNREWRWYAKYDIPHSHKGNWYFVKKEERNWKEEITNFENKLDKRTKEHDKGE